MKKAFMVTNIKDNRSFLQKLLGYYPRYTLTITDGARELNVNSTDYFFLEDLLKTN